MKRYNCLWNGMSATCTVFYAIIHKVEDPKAHWQNAHVGERRQLMLINTEGYEFVIDNQDGRGWAKSHEGRGMWNWGSAHCINYTVVGECPESEVIKVVNEERKSADNSIYRKWFKETYPADYERYCKLLEAGRQKGFYE